MRRPALLLASLTVLLAAPTSAPAVVEERQRAAGDVHTVGGCRVFPADNPWNRRIDRRPVWRWSAAIVAARPRGRSCTSTSGRPRSTTASR